MDDGISEVEAEERTEKDIQMKDRQRILQKLRQIIEDIMYLRNSRLIRDMLEMSFTTKSAIRAVVSNYKEEFDNLFHDDETESQMSVDEEVYDNNLFKYICFYLQYIYQYASRQNFYRSNHLNLYLF